jgi:fatty acid-binding protein DegV
VLQDLKGQTAPKLCIMHAAAPELGKQVADDLARELGIATPMLLEAGPAIATHAGPGAVGVGYIM